MVQYNLSLVRYFLRLQRTIYKPVNCVQTSQQLKEEIYVNVLFTTQMGCDNQSMGSIVWFSGEQQTLKKADAKRGQSLPAGN